MIKAIIFDCFGVLVSDGWLPFKRQYFGHDPELFRRVTSLNHQVDAGQIHYGDYIETVAKLAHLPAEDVRARIEHNTPNIALFEYIETLKPNYSLGMLSNAAADWTKRLFTSEQGALFDAMVLSFQVGVTKPDPKMYEAMLGRLKVDPSEAVYIDDQLPSVQGARQLGLAAIHYQDMRQLQHELRALLPNT